ncbi:MAG: hypothetical protein C0467_14090 [Planctomycetaceae bacterium]|nr:hypothetical protein [Planctomycetaceae bacterium]
MSLKQHILNYNDNAPIPCPVPEWETTVFIRRIKAGERASWLGKYEQAQATKSGEDMQACLLHLVLLCTVDEQGQQVFGPDDFNALADKSATAIDRLLVAAVKANGLHGESVNEAKKN